MLIQILHTLMYHTDSFSHRINVQTHAAYSPIMVEKQNTTMLNRETKYLANLNYLFTKQSTPLYRVQCIGLPYLHKNL